MAWRPPWPIWLQPWRKKSPIGLRRIKRIVDDGQEQSRATALRYKLALNAQHTTLYGRAEGQDGPAQPRHHDLEPALVGAVFRQYGGVETCRLADTRGQAVIQKALHVLLMCTHFLR